MKYKLISRSLQERLDEISGGDFSKQFDEISRLFAREGRNPFARPRTVFFDLKHDTPALLSIDVTHDMVEECDEYNPKAWNKFPEVEPPEGVFMRVELSGGGKACAIFHHFSDEDLWCYPSGKSWPKAYSDSVIRFRPWDDEE